VLLVQVFTKLQGKLHRKIEEMYPGWQCRQG